MELACQCPAVVVCRCSPTQKADIVKLLKTHTRKRTCSIGQWECTLTLCLCVSLCVSPCLHICMTVSCILLLKAICSIYTSGFSNKLADMDTFNKFKTLVSLSSLWLNNSAQIKTNQFSVMD